MQVTGKTLTHHSQLNALLSAVIVKYLIFLTLYRFIRVEFTGIYRAVPVRLNPNKRTLHTIFKTFIDVVHVRTTNEKRVCHDISTLIKDSNSEKFNATLTNNSLNNKVVEKIKELSKREDIYDLLTRSIGMISDILMHF